jgi:hypothetical protein
MSAGLTGSAFRLVSAQTQGTKTNFSLGKYAERRYYAACPKGYRPVGGGFEVSRTSLLVQGVKSGADWQVLSSRAFKTGWAVDLFMYGAVAELPPDPAGAEEAVTGAPGASPRAEGQGPPSTRARMQTFVVRVWSQPADRGPRRLQGVVEHVASGESTSFVSAEQLLAFVHEAAGRSRGEATGGGSS